MRIISVLMVIILSLLLVQSCDKKKTIEVAKDILKPILVNSFEKVVRDPEVLDAYREGGWSAVREVAPSLYINYVKNDVSKLATGSDIERKAYNYLMDNWPTAALALYREGELGPEGIWVRFDLWARSEGYKGASIETIFMLTPQQREFLMDQAGNVIMEEWKAAQEYRHQQSHHSTEPRGIDIGDEDW